MPAIHRLPEEIWPEFGFDQNKGAWAKGVQCPADGEVEIRGIVNFADGRRHQSLQFSHASGSGGGDNKLVVRKFWGEFAQQLSADADFADADGVKPDAGFAAGAAQGGVIDSEALAETRLPIAAPPHFQEIKGRAEDEENREQNVINQTH